MYYFSDGGNYENLSQNLFNQAIQNGEKIAFSQTALNQKIEEIGGDIKIFKWEISESDYLNGLNKIIEMFKPNFELIYSYIESGYKNDIATLQKIKCVEIDYYRDEAINKGVEYEGVTYQSAKNDRDLLTSTAILYKDKELPANFKWIAADNSLNDFTYNDLIALGEKMGQSVNLYTIQARTLKDKALQATTSDEIKAIKWA